MASDPRPEEHQAAPVSRRAVVTGAGAVTTAVVLGACATYGSKPAAPAAPAAGGNTGGGAAADALAKTSEIPVGGGKIFEDQSVVVTQATAGNFAAFSTVCTHQGCNVNTISGGTINCPCHGSKFTLDGSVAKGPASSPLEERNVQVQGDSIILA